MQQRPRLHDNNSANPSKSKRATEILTQLKIHQNGTRQRFSSAIMHLLFGSSPSNGRSQQRQTPRLSSSSTQKLQHRLHHPTACICPTGIIRPKKGQWLHLCMNPAYLTRLLLPLDGIIDYTHLEVLCVLYYYRHNFLTS